MPKLLVSSTFLLLSILFAGCSPIQPVIEIEATSTLIKLEPQSSSTPTLASTIPVTFAPSGPTATPFVHIVQQGETLLGIAIRYGVSLDALLLVNPGVDPRILSVGQSLRIPGPGGEPVDMLLPTPTPIPISLEPVQCFPTTGRTIRCLTKVRNTWNAPIEGITVQISLVDSAGNLLDQSLAFSQVRLLPEGQTSVLETTFEQDQSQIASTQAELISAVQVSNLEGRFVVVETNNLHLERFSDNRLFRIEGTIALKEEEAEGRVLLTIQAFGYDLNGAPIGVNAIQFQLDRAEFPHPFKLSLFSLRGEIEDFEIFVEAQPLFNAE